MHSLCTVVLYATVNNAFIVILCAQYFCPILKTFRFFDRFSYKSPISNLTKIRPVGAKLIQVDTLMDKHNEANRHFL